MHIKDKTSQGERDILLDIAKNIGLQYRETISESGHKVEVTLSSRGFHHTVNNMLKSTK